MGDTEYTKLSLPLNFESSPRSNRSNRAAAKLVAGISGLVIFGYVMSATYFSTPEASAINLNFSEARLQGLVDQYQLELASSPVKVANFGNAHKSDQGLAMSKDNSLAAFINLKNKIEVWNVQKKELVARFTHSDNQLKDLVFTPDSKYLLSFTSSDNFVNVWDISTKSLYGQIETDDSPNELIVTSDSKFVVYRSYFKTALLDILNLKVAHSFTSSANDISMTPDSKYLAVGAYYGSIQIFDMSTLQEITVINNSDVVDHLKISDDGKIVATGDYSSKTTKAWNVETGKLITKIQHREGVSDIDLSPDGRFLCSSSFDGTTIVYDLNAKKIYTKIRRWIQSFAFTKDSKSLLVSNGNLVQVIDIKKKKEVASLKHLRDVNRLYPSQNGEYLLVSTSWSVYLWNLSNLNN